MKSDLFNEKSSKFIKWFQANGGTISSKVKISDLRSQDQGRGLIATSDISEDEELFTIPRDLILNIDTGSISQNQLNHNNLRSMGHWEGLILTLLFEYSKGDKSKWKPYIDLLPNSFMQLMWWDEKELELLQPSFVLERIGKKEAEEMFDEMKSVDLKNMKTENTTTEEFHRIASVILSYSFDVEHSDMVEVDSDLEEDEIEIPEGETNKDVSRDGYFKSMVPLADLLNADTNLCNANLIYTPDRLVMKSTKEIKANEQIYNTYGDHPNSELLRRYGYVEWSGSEYDLAEINPEHIIAAACSQFAPIATEEYCDKCTDFLVENIDEEIMMEFYDIYSDGSILNEAVVFAQFLTILCLTKVEIKATKKHTRNLLVIYEIVLKSIESSKLTEGAKFLLEKAADLRTQQYKEENPILSGKIAKLSGPLNGFNSNSPQFKQAAAECVINHELSSLNKLSKYLSASFTIIRDSELEDKLVEKLKGIKKNKKPSKSKT